ncbi:fungal protein [Schizosaccharomyces cryophilus OY26]|uniref:Fungal protein n=1 Tax=Schizosaccharomyces cryophilus (strain OY26 / ATCC MYA-4695 / CBS 11777 / NBRC 106824 / NRRL Y48691) TaxID=653667 RepID=S9XJH0_SCHCR|nr:uncharacterized protein SPOG_02933 [Schizosaccharomyces cryophilus OY26]EPY53836.1 fungal protein [Schizosaccharomyces cryophilus OY26]
MATAETTRADPSTAIMEPEPYEFATMQKGKHVSALLSKDYYGQPIDEPDVSNPTRWKYERPLDTVRAWQFLTDNDEESPKPHLDPEHKQYHPTAESFRPLSFASMEQRFSQRLSKSLSRRLSKASSRHSRL